LTVDVPATTCFAIDGESVKINSVTLSRGSCTFVGPKVSGPAPTFDKENVACGLPQHAVCTMKAECVATPIPEQPFTRLCIHKAGDESCPSLDYTARFVAHTSTLDERTCTCAGNPSGGACGDTVQGFKLAGCSATGAGEIPFSGVCFSGAVNHVNVAKLAPTGTITCTGTIAGSAGTVKDTDPVTFCCNK
jgi:hypothetical protein